MAIISSGTGMKLAFILLGDGRTVSRVLFIRIDNRPVTRQDKRACYWNEFTIYGICAIIISNKNKCIQSWVGLYAMM